jgi:hypothetical protein
MKYISSRIFLLLLFVVLISELIALQTFDEVSKPIQPGEVRIGRVRVPGGQVQIDEAISIATETAYRLFPHRGDLLLRGFYFDQEADVGIYLIVTVAPPSQSVSSETVIFETNANSSEDICVAIENAINCDSVDVPPPLPPAPSRSGVDFTLENAINRVLADIPSRSRIGIGHITTSDRSQRRRLADVIEDILLDYNMRVVDRSERHVVIEEIGEHSELVADFRHADYVLTVRQNDESIRVRIINVRNGEVAGIATERF